MHRKTFMLCLSMALAFPLTGLAEETVTSVAPPATQATGSATQSKPGAAPGLAMGSGEAGGMPCPMHQGGMEPGPGGMMGQGMMHHGPGGMMGYGGSGKPCRMKGGMKGSYKDHQAGRAAKHEDMINRLNRIEAALAKIEAMLNHLVNQR